MAKTTHRKITLLIDGEEKTFYSKFASARNVFKAQDLFKKMETNEDEQEAIMEVLNFLAKDIYHDEFTADDVLDGTDSAEFMTMVQDQLIAVMTKDVKETKDFLIQQQAKKK
ncbi:phage tail assembly chaperone G [Corticicoccus populi]|uniref:Phage tail assembly chaperone G n=1 Tax=Corticicoccus populi TaxID=1812821 RepID=A0ABW5WQZ0_9STAP